MSRKPIEKTIAIRAPREAVWRALSEAEEITRWFAPDARVEPGTGGKVWISWPGMEAESRIEVWEPNTHLRTTNEQRKTLLSVDYHLEGKQGDTVLRLVHSGFGEEQEWDDEYDDLELGWEAFLRTLRFYLERHPGEACRQAVMALPIALPWDEAWARLSRKLGLGGAREGGPWSEGQIDLLAAPRAFGGTLAKTNDASLRILLEHMDHKPFCWAMLYTYGVPQVEVDALGAHWKSLLEGVWA